MNNNHTPNGEEKTKMETKQMTAENRTAQEQEKIDFGITEENLKHFIMNNEVKFEAIVKDYPDLLKRFVKTDGKTSQINGLSSTEERLRWCEEYIKVLLTFKDESRSMHNLDGQDISDIKQRLSKLEGGQD